MQVAVTGATGFIGRHIVRQLVGQGHRCRCWYRAESSRQGLEDVAHAVEWVPGELGDRQASTRLLRGCEAVIHAALYHPGAGFRGSEGDLIDFARANVLGTLELVEAARGASVDRFVFISTCAVHEQILGDRPLDENHPTTPRSHYGAHKAAIEQFVHSYGWGEGYSICALRPTGVYGLAHPPMESKWFELVRTVVRGGPVACQGGGKEVHAADVAKAAALLLAAPNVAGEVYNCYDRHISEYEVATLASRLTGSQSIIRGGQTGPKNQIVTDKLRALGMTFGGEALLEQTIRHLIDAARPRN